MNRPNLSEKSTKLAELYLSGLPYKLIASVHGGTPQGVRSTIRKMIERGSLSQRAQRRNPYSGRFA